MGAGPSLSPLVCLPALCLVQLLSGTRLCYLPMGLGLPSCWARGPTSASLMAVNTISNRGAHGGGPSAPQPHLLLPVCLLPPGARGARTTPLPCNQGRQGGPEPSKACVGLHQLARWRIKPQVERAALGTRWRKVGTLEATESCARGWPGAERPAGHQWVGEKLHLT